HTKRGAGTPSEYENQEASADASGASRRAQTAVSAESLGSRSVAIQARYQIAVIEGELGEGSYYDPNIGATGAVVIDRAGFMDSTFTHEMLHAESRNNPAVLSEPWE